MNYKCNICGNTNLKEINLPDFPLTEYYTDKPSKEIKIDQKFLFCENCSHGQLYNFPDFEIYRDLYGFRTSVGGSRFINDVLADYIYEHHNLDKFDKIVEIGCNDGYLLSKLDHKHKIGIDPSVDKLNYRGIELISDYIENVDISLENSLVISNQLLEHIRDPKKLFDILYQHSDDRTRFVFGFPILNTLVSRLRFDQIFHHHQQYFTKESFSELLRRTGFKLTNSMEVKQYWGTYIASFKKGEEINSYFVDKLNWDKIKNNYIIFLEYLDIM